MRFVDPPKVHYYNAEEQPCDAPMAEGQTHHLIPKRSGGTAECPSFELTCSYCGCTVAELKAK